MQKKTELTGLELSAVSFFFLQSFMMLFFFFFLFDQLQTVPWSSISIGLVVSYSLRQLCDLPQTFVVLGVSFRLGGAGNGCGAAQQPEGPRWIRFSP